VVGELVKYYDYQGGIPMPARIRKVDGEYSVSTPGGTKAKHTTKAKAKAQQRLLNAIDHGFKPRRTKGGKYDDTHGEFCISRAKANGVEMP